MDSWNNREGRKIAKEIKKEYGEKHFKMIKEIKETESNSQRGTHPRANQTLPNNIIPNQNINFNPKKAIISVLNNKPIQEGIKETINKSSQISAYQNMEKKDKPYWDKSFVNFDGISLNGKKWRDWICIQ